MKVSCPGCKKSLNVPDEKIPLDRPLTFKCPNCQGPVSISRGESTDAGLPSLGNIPETTPTQAGLDETREIPIPPPSGAEDTRDLMKAIESFETEIDVLAEGSKRALVADEKNLSLISPVLKKLDYAVSTVSSVDEALKKMEFNNYDLIVLNERFAGCDPTANGILQHIEELRMSSRRLMFVILVGSNFRSMDRMTAFLRSVNLVMSNADFSNFELILKKEMNEYQAFYRLFFQIMDETGKEV